MRVGQRPLWDDVLWDTRVNLSLGGLIQHFEVRAEGRFGPGREILMAKLKLERSDFRRERAIIRSERARYRPVRADLKPKRADFRFERADFWPKRADCKPERANVGSKRGDLGLKGARLGPETQMKGQTDMRTDVRISPVCPIGHRAFEATARKGE